MNQNNEVIFCRNCGNKKENDGAFCPVCGTNYQIINNEIKEQPTYQQKFCPVCGYENIEEDYYCIECGHKKTMPIVYDKITPEQPVNKPLWIFLLVLSIINMISLGLVAAIATVILFILLFVEFTDAIIPFIFAAGYLALSIYAIVKCSKKIK